MEFVRVRALIAAAILTASILGCGGGESPAEPGKDTAPDTPEAPPLEVMGLVTALNPANVLSYFVFWTTDRPATTVVDVDCGDYVATIASEDRVTDHEVVVLGLYPGADCVFAAGGVAEDGGVGSLEVPIKVGVAPAPLPALDLLVRDGDRLQPGWTAFNLSNTVVDVRPIIAVVDDQGRYRWYHVRSTDASGSAMLVRRVPEGFLVGGGSDQGRTWPAIIDLEGRVIWESQLEDEHHEILPWGDGGDFMYLSKTKDCPEGIGETATIVVHDSGTAGTEWEWALCQHFTPEVGKKDWDHSNAIDPFPENDALLLSVRNISRVFKVDLETEDVLWTLGVGGDFTRSDESEEPPFLRQHAAELIGDDRIILFDNGQKGVRETSGAVEIAFDEETMEYHVAWSWFPDPPIFAKVWGDADRLENGNTLITFGRRKTNVSHLIEATHGGDRVWELVAPVGWGWYRAERMEPLPAGIVVTH